MSGWIDGARYFLALLVLVTLPPAVLYWFLIHPLAPSWRRLGAAVTWGVVLPVCVACGVLLFRYRQPLLAPEYGFRWPLALVGAASYAVAVVIELRCRRELSLATLVGLPEISPARRGRLLTEGIYARTRNPRYLSLLAGLAGLALFTNYLALWVLLALAPPVIYLLVLVEERELRGRFGSEYERYLARVPRFLPRIR